MLKHFDLLAQAPDGVARLRELILTLAVQGKLVPQDPNDEPASVLLQRIRAEKDRLIAEGKIKRDKPLPPIIDDEQPFELPIGWKWVRLNALLQKIGAGSTPLGGREVYVSSGVKFLRSQNVWNDGLRLDGVAFIKPETHARMGGTVVLPNDLLFNITGASIGRCATVPADFDEANVSQHVTIIRTVLPALNPFLHKVLVSRHVQQTVMDVQVGVSREGLSIAKLGQFLIPLPPLAEQSRIVARVEELMRLCDALETKKQFDTTQHAQLVQTLLGTLTDSTTPEELAAAWQRVATHFDLLLDRPEAVDALEQTILQLAVRGLLVPQDPTDEPASVLLQRIRAERDRLIAMGKIKRDKLLPPIADEEKPLEIPIGWELVRLGDLIELVSGQHLGPNEYIEGPGACLPYLTGPAEFGDISPEPSRSTNERRAIALANDILITVKGSGVGKLNVVTQPELAISRQLMAIRPLIVNREFVKIVLQTLAIHFQEKAVGIAIPGIGREDVTHAVIGLPPLDEQFRVVKQVEKLCHLSTSLRQYLTTSDAIQANLAEALVEAVATA